MIKVVQETLLADPGIIPLAYDPYSALFLATPHTFATAWTEWLGPRVCARFKVSEKDRDAKMFPLKPVQSAAGWNVHDVYGYIAQWMSHCARDRWWTTAERTVLHTLVEHTLAYKDKIQLIKDSGHNPKPPPTSEGERCAHCDTVLGCVRCHLNPCPDRRCVRHIVVKRRASLYTGAPPGPPKTKPTFVMTNTRKELAIPPKVRLPNTP